MTRTAFRFRAGLALLLLVTSESAYGWGDVHEKITQAAFDVQPQALKSLWSASYQHPQDSSQHTIQEYLVEYVWWSGNPDHVDGPLNGSFAGEERKNYVKLFHYGERNGQFAVPTPFGLPYPPEGPAWTYHYFSFPPPENSARAGRGAAWYFDRIIEAFQDNRPADAAQYAGSVAHAVEDRSSPVHAWDGYDAERIALEVANGLDGNRIHGFSVFWFIDDSGVDATTPGYVPSRLGADSAAAGQEAATRLQRITDASRAILSDPAGYLGSHLSDDWNNSQSSPATDAFMSEMAKESTRLVADVFFTGCQLAIDSTVAFTTVTLDSATGMAFHSATGATYRLDASDDLVDPDFRPTGSFLEGNGGALIFFDPTGPSTTKTYQIRVMSD